jgi:hypothetical protein
MKKLRLITASVKLSFAVACLLATSFGSLSAQTSQVMYYMNLPQNHLLNPALRPSNRVYVGLPGISGTAIRMNNNFVNFDDIIMRGGPQDSLITFLHPGYNADKFLAKIKDKNSVEPEGMVQLFGLGFTAGKSYIFLDINERVAGNFVIPGDLFRLALKGNSGFVGNSIDLSSLRGEMKAYHEVGFGFSRNYTERLRIGIKAKALFGIVAAGIDNNKLAINVDGDYAHTLNADMTYNFSFPHTIGNQQNAFLPDIKFNDFEPGNILETGNMGFGLDLGATYDLGKRIMLSAALTDIGFIKWKKNVSNMTVKGQYTFNGLDLTEVLNGSQSIDEAGQAIVDSLDSHFKSVNTENPFTTFLPYGFTAGASLRLTKSIGIGVLSYSRFIGTQVKQTLTFSANINLGNALSTTLTYTAANHRYDNIGAGLSFRLGWMQIYAATDRIPIVWNKLVVDNGKGSIYLPSSWNSADIRIGMNFVFGNRAKKVKAPVVETPAEEGVVEEK